MLRLQARGTLVLHESGRFVQPVDVLANDQIAAIGRAALDAHQKECADKKILQQVD